MVEVKAPERNASVGHMRNSWSAPRVLLSYEGATDGGYPSSSQCEDGTIVTVYYSNRIPDHHCYHMGVARWQAEE